MEDGEAVGGEAAGAGDAFEAAIVVAVAVVGELAAVGAAGCFAESMIPADFEPVIDSGEEIHDCVS